MILKITSTILWFIIISIGFHINASALDANVLINIPLYMISYTVTNVGILSILAALIGGSETPIKHGFFVYVMIISGSVVLFTESLTNPTQEQYAKIAGVTSLVSLLIANKPELFEDFMNRVTLVFTGE